MDNLVERLMTLPQNLSQVSDPFMIVLESTIPDISNQSKKVTNSLETFVTNYTKVSSIIAEFIKKYPQYDGYDFTIQYNNTYFSNGTIGEIGVTADKKVILIPRKRNYDQDEKDEKFGFWIIPPISLSIVFILSGIIRNVEFKVRLSYLIFGIFLFIPTTFLFLKENMQKIKLIRKCALRFLRKTWTRIFQRSIGIENLEESHVDPTISSNTLIS